MISKVFATPCLALPFVLVACETMVAVDYSRLERVCDPGRTQCADGRCYDLQSNGLHCGACGRACGASETCSGGICVCSAGLERCGPTCVDTSSDPQNCGACGRACSADEVCRGSCGPLCQDPATNCSGSCVRLDIDSENCGQCGHSCLCLAPCVEGKCPEDRCPSASSVIDQPGEKACGDVVCGPAELCCLGATPYCASSCGMDTPVACDGPEDCELATDICCARAEATDGGPLRYVELFCTPPANCPSTGATVVICHPSLPISCTSTICRQSQILPCGYGL